MKGVMSWEDRLSCWIFGIQPTFTMFGTRHLQDSVYSWSTPQISWKFWLETWIFQDIIITFPKFLPVFMTTLCIFKACASPAPCNSWNDDLDKSHDLFRVCPKVIIFWDLKLWKLGVVSSRIKIAMNREQLFKQLFLFVLENQRILQMMLDEFDDLKLNLEESKSCAKVL